MAPSVLDAASGVVAGQLASASGRTLDVVAAQVPDEEVPTSGDPDTVAGESAASTDYAQTLAALADAEKAAAEQLALSQQDAAAAAAEQKQAEADLASEEAAAAKEIDNAVSAAIAAAEAQTTAAGSIPLVDPVAPGETTDPTSVVGPTDTTGGVAPVVTENPAADTGSQLPSGGAAITAGNVLALVRKYFPAGEVSNAMAVARCESSLTNQVSAMNQNGTHDFGLFQLNDGGTLQAALRRINEPFTDTAQARQKALDAEVNVRMARVLWDSRGWQPWVCAADLKIVSGLYQRAPGPMYGKYNEQGR
jgi:hypothetical protein